MTQYFKRLDENTSLSFKIVAPLVLAIISGTVWIQSTLAGIASEIKSTIPRAEVIEWRNQLADQNRNLSVPYIHTK